MVADSTSWNCGRSRQCFAPLQRHKVRQPLLQQDLLPDHLQSYRKARRRRLPRGSRRRRGKPARRRFQGALGVVMPWLGAWSIIVPSQAFRFQANHHHHHHASVVTVVDSASLDFGKISWACSCPKQKRWRAKAVELWLCDWETYHAKRAQFKVQSQSFIRMFHMYAIKKRSFVRMHMTRSTDLCANIPLINS